MRRHTDAFPLRLLSCLLTLFLLSGALICAGAAAQEPDAGDTACDGYCALLREDCTVSPELEAQLSDLEQVTDRLYWSEDLTELEALAASEQVLSVEPNYYAALFDVSAQPDAPADPGWPYEALRADYASACALTGDGVRIAVIDSGLDAANPDLQSAKVLGGYNFVSESDDVTDSIHHGTRVTQILAADANGLGVTGLSAGAEIVPLKCFETASGGTVRMLSQAIYAAVDDYHCDVINMSWGLASDSQILHEAIEYAYNAGVILVAAAGNVSASYPQGTLLYPAAYDEVVSVSAVNSALQILSSSQNNIKVMVCAPGGSIPFVNADGSAAKDSGTSFAAPCVSAAAALLRQLVPELTPDAFFSLLRERSVDLGDPGFDPAYGNGLPRLDALLQQRRVWLEDTPEGRVIRGWLIRDGGGVVYAASYLPTGRMTDVSMQTLTLDAQSFSFSVPSGEGLDFSVYYLDRQDNVLCENDWLTDPS